MKPTVAGGAAVASAILVAACSSSSHGTSTADTTARQPSATSSPAGAPTTGAPHLTATVYNCGGGAYEPATLLIVCGVDSTMATGVTWTSWSASGASGRGDVALSGHPAEPASLELRDVVTTTSGPQFSELTLTWSGASPDGHPSDTFHLATAAA